MKMQLNKGSFDDAAAGCEAQHRFLLPGHPRTLADCDFSLGSAAVGAALSSPPTPRDEGVACGSTKREVEVN